MVSTGKLTSNCLPETNSVMTSPFSVMLFIFENSTNSPGSALTVKGIFTTVPTGAVMETKTGDIVTACACPNNNKDRIIERTIME